jgi:hypothetical protein
MKVLLIRAAVIDVTGWQFGHVNGTKLRGSHDQVPLVMVRASAGDAITSHALARHWAWRDGTVRLAQEAEGASKLIFAT